MIDLLQLTRERNFAGMHNFAVLLAGFVIALDAKQVLEIGTGIACSTRAFLFGLEITDGNIITCDIVRRTDFSHKRMKFFNMSSNSLAEIWREEIDILFIDGSHKYEDVDKDFKNFFPFVRKGGLTLFHDINWPNDIKESGRHWRELVGRIRSGSENMTCIEFLGYAGLGVVQKC